MAMQESQYTHTSAVIPFSTLLSMDKFGDAQGKKGDYFSVDQFKVDMVVMGLTTALGDSSHTNVIIQMHCRFLWLQSVDSRQNN